MARLIPRQDLALLQLLGQGGGGRTPAELSREDWGDLYRRAVERRVPHLLYGRLRHRAGTPAEVLDELREYYLMSATGNTHRVHQIGRVLALFRERGIGVAVLKGAYLAEAAYGNIALRTMCDVDLLVRETDIERAKAVLLEAGFRQYWQAPLETAVSDIHHLAPFVRDGRRKITIELHRHLLPPQVGQVDTAALWERTRTARVADVEVLALCPEDLLLHVCMHACLQHRLAEGVVSLLDVDAILHAFARELDWDALIARAELWGGGDSAALMLTYAVDLCGARIPAGVLARLAPGGLSSEVIDLADRQIFKAGTLSSGLSITLTRLFHAAGPGSFIAILRERFFPSRAELLVRYRVSFTAWLPLLYFVHPFVLLGIHGRSALRLLTGSKRERKADEELQRGLALAQALTSKVSRRIKGSSS